MLFQTEAASTDAQSMLAASVWTGKHPCRNSGLILLLVYYASVAANLTTEYAIS